MSHARRAALSSAALAVAVLVAAPAAPAKPAHAKGPSAAAEGPSGSAKGPSAAKGSAKSTKVFKALLSGAGETPAGDPDGSGRALVRIKGTQVCFTLRAADIDAPAAAHIHQGAAGVAGPVVVDLFAGTPARKGCVTTSAEVAAAIRVDPRGFYVNVHTAAFPDGAIRGQLQQGGAATP